MTSPTSNAKARVAKRNNLLAQIHIAKKALNWSDEEYRSLLFAVCQVRSSGQLDMAGQLKFLDHCRKCGWQASLRSGKAPSTRKKLSPKVGKMFSLWQQLYEASKVRDRSYKALEAWAQAQTAVAKLEWLNDAQQAQCIESLKLWLSRKGA